MSIFDNLPSPEDLDKADMTPAPARRRAPAKSDLTGLLAQADERNGFPAGTMASVMQQESGGNAKYLDDPSTYHYGLNADGRRIAGHTGKVSTAFGPFGILESTGRDPGYGVAPLRDKSLEEQVRFASEYLAARSRRAGGLQAGLSDYGEGGRYGQQVMDRIGRGGATPSAAPAAQAAAPSGSFMDGILRADDPIMRGYVDPTPAKPTKRSFASDAYEVGRQVGAGFAVDLPRMIGQGMRWTDIEGVEGAGRSMVESADERAKGWEPDLQGRGLLAGTLIKGGRAVGPMAPAIAASMVPGGQFIAPAVATGLFGLGAAQDTEDKLRLEGRPDGDATAAGWRTGLIQGPLEGIATAVGGAAFKPLGRALGLAGKTTTGVAGEMTDTAILKPLAKGLGLNLLVQPATEVAQDVGTELVERSYGAKPEDAWDIAKESAQGAIGLTLLLGPFAAGAHVQRSKQAAALKDALYNPATDPMVRADARDLVATQAKKQGVAPKDIDSWLDARFAEDDALVAQAAQAEQDGIQSEAQRLFDEAPARAAEQRAQDQFDITNQIRLDAANQRTIPPPPESLTGTSSADLLGSRRDPLQEALAGRPGAGPTPPGAGPTPPGAGPTDSAGAGTDAVQAAAAAQAPPNAPTPAPTAPPTFTDPAAAQAHKERTARNAAVAQAATDFKIPDTKNRQSVLGEVMDARASDLINDRQQAEFIADLQDEANPKAHNEVRKKLIDLRKAESGRREMQSLNAKADEEQKAADLAAVQKPADVSKKGEKVNTSPESVQKAPEIKQVDASVEAFDATGWTERPKSEKAAAANPKIKLYQKEDGGGIRKATVRDGTIEKDGTRTIYDVIDTNYKPAQVVVNKDNLTSKVTASWFFDGREVGASPLNGMLDIGLSVEESIGRMFTAGTAVPTRAKQQDVQANFRGGLQAEAPAAQPANTAATTPAPATTPTAAKETAPDAAQPANPGETAPAAPVAQAAPPAVGSAVTTAAAATTGPSTGLSTRTAGTGVALPEVKQDTNALADSLIAKLKLDPEKVVMVGRKNKQKSMRAREFIHNLATAPRQDIARVMAVMGRDADGDQVGSPLTLDQVAILESRFTGNAPVSKEAIRATLLKYGIDAPMVNMLIGTDLTSLDGAELTNGEASLAAAGYRSDTSLTKLTNDGFGNEGSSMGAARPGEAAPRLSAADRKALDVLGKNTVKQNKLERDNAAVDEFLAPPKQEAPEVVANRLATAEKTKLAPAPRIAQVNGELEEVEIDEQVQKERALEAEIKAAQIAWNSNLDAGDVAFEDMPSRLQLEVLRLERAVDEGTMTARQRRELQFELQERANEQRTDTPGIQGPDAGAQAPRSGQVRIGNDTDQTGTGVDLAPAEQPERAGVPEPTLDTGNATSQRESAADTDITDAPDKNERRARVQDAYEQAEIDADQEFELATAYDADPGSDAFLDRLSEDLSKPSAELPKPIRKAVARIAKLAPPAPVAAIGDDSRTIDGTGLIREVSEAEMELVTGALSNRPGELALLESTYGAKSGTDEFIAKLREDVVRFANGMVTKIDAAIRGIIRGIANGVLAVGLVFNPGAFTKGLDINLPRTVSVWTTAQTQIEVTPTVTVPANAEAKMSPLARQVYTSMAPAAAKTGKGFMIADKPMGMLHVFKPDGSLLVQDAALYGKDSGDAVTGLGSLSGGAKITPAGQYTLKTTLDPEYAGGMRIDLAETLGGGQVIAVHAAWMGDAAENRGARLKSPTASDNKISYGCINTSHDMFLKSVMPNAAMLEGGLIFVMPDATQNTSAMFPQQTETRTSETTSVADSQQRDSGARADTSRTVMGKEEKAQFSQGTQSRGSTAQQVTAEVQGMMATSARLVVVDKLTDLPAAVQDAVSKQSTNGKAVRGFVLNGRGYLVAGNITPGTARSVFMHEVGVHLGLDKILSPALHRQLADKLRAWAALGNNSQESRIAQAAMARVEQAGTDAADQNSELIAYFVEEAMNAGIDPTAMQHKGEMARWFRSLWAAFKSAMRKLGINADKLTAQDVVDMAYGAAKLEMSGAWHGTAGSFRKFDHKFMGSGEGAQAFGWGSYFAQRRGIAKGYFATDVANKGISVDLQRQRDAELSRLALDLKVAQDAVADPNTPSELAELMKATIPELARKLSDRQAHWAKFNDAPDGALMRVDFSVADDEWLDLDKPMSEQSEKVQAAIKDSGHGWMDKTTTGRQFYDQVSREQAPYDEDGEQAPGTSNDKAASEYLDSIGIKGNKFLDANSRGGEENKMSNLVVFNDKNIQRVASLVGADAGRVKFSVGPQAQAEQRLAETGKAVGSTLTRWMQNVGNVASFTEDLVRRAVDAGMRSAKAYEVAQAARGAQVRAHERKVHDVLEKFSNLPYAAQQAANKVLYDSTRESKWGYAPPWDPKAVVDPVMAARLQALGKDSPAAVTFIKAVFQHGHDTLIDKKKSAMDHVETEYAALIEDVKMDPEAVALLQKEKKRLLERFTSLFAVQGKGPYAPLRRDGNFLVLAKSKAFVAAELNADNAAIERMMRDPNHYMVSMAKTEVEGQALANALRATGKYDTAPESVLSRPKEAALQDLYGGNSMMGAFLKLKSRIEVERGEASREEAGTLRRMNQMVTQMYLESLSEGSARKSEMRRIGVAAQNMDMVAGFAAQGVADAQFMATVAHGGDILKSIGAMRKEWKGPGGTAEQTAKGKLFNEIVARHVQSMDFKPTPLADGLTRASSIWMLATSPAYYLANLTQTWLISLPYMTKQHDYTAAAGAIFKAYGDVKNLLGTAKVFSSLDFSKVPEADRKAVRALLDMGVIDAGLDTDTGSIKLERSGPVAAGWNKVDNSLRIISQKVEAVNRLSAGLAAYRLELARTQSHEAAVEYARNVITQTHGDYTRGNAPRVFNTAAGKVALQFRKFQLIQIGLIGSLAKQAFAGATPAEKAVARRALGFMFAHLGAVGGAIALPGYALIGSLAAGLLGGDGPDDADEMLRRAIGDKHISDLLLNGLPGLVGAGIGDRVGFGKILSPLPFSKAPVDRTSFKEITYDAITGPFGGLALKGVSGLQMMAKGDYMKGLEYLLPNGLGNMLKAGRYATEGVTNTKGELLMNADEIRGVDTFLQGLGITPLAQSRRMELQNAKYEVDAYFNAQSASIRKAYLEGDRAEAMQAWREMNEVRVARGYRIAPMSDLLRAPREAAKRAKMVAGGVQFDRSNKGFVVGRSEE